MLQSAKAAFDVTTIVHFYQPNTPERLLETGREGTPLVSPNFIVLQKAAQVMDDFGASNIRKIWSYVTSAKTKNNPSTATPGDHILPTLIAAAETGVPSEYELALPLPERFKKDPTYFQAQIQQPNDASFTTVIKLLIPFVGIRESLLRIQDELIVPLHSIKLGFVASDMAFRAAAPVGLRAPTLTLQ